MSSILIASIYQDRRTAEVLDGILTRAGHATWVEWRDMATGTAWEGAVRRALERCDLLAMVLTRESGNEDMMLAACRVAKAMQVPTLALCMEAGATPSDALEPLLQEVLWMDADYDPADNDPSQDLMKVVEYLVVNSGRGQPRVQGLEDAPAKVPPVEDPFSALGSLGNRPGMFCGQCGADNPEFLSACRSCGASMLLDLASGLTHMACPVCTSINPPAAKWCRVCGSDVHVPSVGIAPHPSEDDTRPVTQPLGSFLPQCGPEKVGRLVGPWRLLRWIGRGGQGTVYEAIHVYLRTAAALKVLQVLAGPGGLFTAWHGDSIRRSLRGLAVLHSPYVAKTLDFGEADLPEGARYFIVTELVRGRSLRDLMPQLAHDSEESFGLVMRLFRQICLGVQAAHEVRYFDDAGFELAGVLHGDIKPANVIVTARDEVKLIDFLLFKSPPTNTGDPDVQTCASGTPGYMAPEQMAEGVISVGTDIYGLGATLLQMLTLALPHSMPPVETEAYVRRLEELNPRAVAVATLLRRCLALDPRQRFGSVQDLVAALPV